MLYLSGNMKYKIILFTQPTYLFSGCVSNEMLHKFRWCYFLLTDSNETFAVRWVCVGQVEERLCYLHLQKVCIDKLIDDKYDNRTFPASFQLTTIGKGGNRLMHIIRNIKM